jgi:hypothetical protein
MTNTDRFAIVPLRTGPPPDDALMIGPLDLIMQNLPDTLARADALDRLEAATIKSDQIKIMREAIPAIKALAFCDAASVVLPAIARRFDAYITRRTARLRAEAAEEERQIEDALSKLPDPDQPHEWDAPPPPGELHTHPPTAKISGDQSGTDPVLEPALDPDDAEGDLPNSLTEKTNPVSNTEPARQPTARNPAAIGLM